MDDVAVLQVVVQAMTVAAKISAPILLTSLCVGFVISLFQSVTQIQEVTLSFVPKALAVAVALVVCGNWMISEMIGFTHFAFDQIPKLLGAA